MLKMIRGHRIPVQYRGQDAGIDARIQQQVDSDAEWEAFSRTVECPTCQAPAGQRCAIKSVSGYHLGRPRRALNAEPFTCFVCGRQIGSGSTHYIVGGLRVIDGRCMETRTNPNAHAVIYPGCTAGWHENFDHYSFVEPNRETTRETLLTFDEDDRRLSNLGQAKVIGMGRDTGQAALYNSSLEARRMMGRI